MSKTLEAEPLEKVAERPTREPVDSHINPFSWRTVLRRASIGAAAGIVAVTLLVFRAVVPPLALILALLVAGAVLAGRDGQKGVTGVVMASLGAAAFLALGGSFVLGVLGAPQEPKEFIPLVGISVLSLAILVSAAGMAIKGRGRGFDGSVVARVTWAAVVAGLVALTVWSLYSAASFESASAASGDLKVEASEFVFEPKVVRAAEGSTSVYVNNGGRGLHTFTIDALDIDVAVPAGKAQRISFQAPTGEYRFYCKLHPGMEGRLVIS